MTAVPMSRPDRTRADRTAGDRNRGADPLATNPLATDPLGTDPLGTEPRGTDPRGSGPLGTGGPASETPGSDPAGPLTGAVFGASMSAGPATEVAPAGGRRVREDDDARLSASRRSASLEDAEPARRGRRAAPDDDDQHDDGALRPGDVSAGKIAFWDDDATRHFRAAWHEVKAEFVDDPVNALTRAHDLLTDAVNELTEALLAERDELDPLRGTATPDTESMRMAMRGYREFLDRILAL